MRRSCMHYLLWINILYSVSGDKKDIIKNCEHCVKFDECPTFAHLNKHEQQIWSEQFPCIKKEETEKTTLFEVKNGPEGDDICCPESYIWKTENNKRRIMLYSKATKSIHKRSLMPDQRIEDNWQNPPLYERPDVLNIPNLVEQCSMQKVLLPDPETLCCGHDITNMFTGGANSFPWFVFLRVTFNSDKIVHVFSCGGSLISRRYVLTAAHCVFRLGLKLDHVDVALGEYNKYCNLEIDNNPDCIDSFFTTAVQVIINSLFHNENLQHDAALLRLQDDVPARYTPICLPTFDVQFMSFTNLELVVAGWDMGHDSDFRQSSVVKYIPRQDCLKFYKSLGETHLCAAGRIGEDARKGDSGGPLMMFVKGKYYLIGLVSGKRDATFSGQTTPSLYTNVHTHIPWIVKCIVDSKY